MRFAFNALLIVMLSAFSTAAPCDNGALRQYIESQEFRTQLQQFGMQWDRSIIGKQPDCRDRLLAKPVLFEELEEVRFGSDDVKPTTGAWLTRFLLDRCGRTVMYNIVAVARPVESSKLVRLVPGNTLASARLMRDVYDQAIPMAGVVEMSRLGKDYSCEKPVIVEDTEVVRRPEVVNAPITSQWEEVWSVKMCDERVDIRLCFTPDGNGGTYFSTRPCG